MRFRIFLSSNQEIYEVSFEPLQLISYKLPYNITALMRDILIQEPRYVMKSIRTSNTRKYTIMKISNEIDCAIPSWFIKIKLHDCAMLY